MINLYEIEPGDILIIKGDRQVECTENMGDGQWLEVTGADGHELVHSQEIIRVITNKEH